MTYRFGNKGKIKEIGETVPLSCPHCNKTVTFSVYSNDAFTIIPNFPLVKNNTVFLLVCPECASVFGVDESAGKTFKKGEALAIGNYDLKALTEFNE